MRSNYGIYGGGGGGGSSESSSAPASTSPPQQPAVSHISLCTVTGHEHFNCPFILSINFECLAREDLKFITHFSCFNHTL